MGIFLYSSHTNFENNGALVRLHGASSPHAHAAQKTPIFSRILPRFLVKSPEFPNKATNN